MFQSFWNKLNALVFLSLVASLAAIYLASSQTDSSIKAVQNILGVYSLLFPVGWLFMAVIFPKQGQVSLLARLVLSISLSIAINSIALHAIFYLLPLPITMGLNILLLLFFGAVFFAAWLGMESGWVKEWAGKKK